MPTKLNVDRDLCKFTEKQIAATTAADGHKFTLYGGSRGPGKSYWLRFYLLRTLLKLATEGIRGAQVGLFCEDYPTLKDRQISKIETEFPAYLGTLRDSTTHGLGFHLIDEYGGGVLTLRNLDDASKYQSAEYAAIGVDELTKNSLETFNYLRGSLRWPGVEKPKFVAASNPGGIGHAWVSDYWIHKRFPSELQRLADDFIFVRALPDDNPHLSAAYWEDLETLPPDLAKAWRWGDWSVFAGQAFREFSMERHVVKPNEIPGAGLNLRAVDWGWSKPFYAGWGRKEADTGRVWVYREAYQAGLTDRQQAQMMRDLTPSDEQISMTFADPSMWTKKNVVNIVTCTADEYAAMGVYLTKADNDRINGIRKIHRLLTNLPDGRPGLMISEQCPHLIKQLQNLAVDKRNPEDVDTNQEDHAFDMLKYLLSNVREATKEEPKPMQHIRIHS
jgi:phage terminase large subunit